MAGGLATTFQTLKDTPNEAAIPILLCALDSRERAVQEAGLEALLQRRSPLAEDEMLRRWPRLSLRWKELIMRRGDWISAAVRKALRHGKDELFLNACDVAVATRDHDAIPLLVAAGEDRSHPHADQAIDAVLQLTEILYEEMTSPRDYRIRRDPQLQRSHVTPCLERAVDTFHVHERSELIEAFCILASRDSAVLKRILQSPGERSHPPLSRVLTQSSRPGVVRLVLNFLDDPFAPLAALHCMAARRDVSFLRQLFRRIDGDSATAIRANLKRIEAVQWFKGSLAIFDALTETEQRGAVQFAAVAGIPRTQACDILAYALRHGHVTTRQAAAAALAAHEGAAANELALKCLEDADPQVRANVLSQLRGRGVPNAIPCLLEALNSPHEVERQAAQKSLDEFSFVRFAANFDTMTAEARRSTGELVRKADPNALAAVQDELEVPSRSRQRRGLEIAVAMGAVADLQDTIIAMLNDEDQFLRVDVVRALTGVDTPEIKAALRQALVDRQPLVQQAAEHALAELSRVSTAAGSATPRVPRTTTPTSVPAHRPSTDTIALGDSGTKTVSVAEVHSRKSAPVETSSDGLAATDEGEFDLQQALADAMSTLEANRPSE